MRVRCIGCVPVKFGSLGFGLFKFSYMVFFLANCYVQPQQWNKFNAIGHILPTLAFLYMVWSKSTKTARLLFFATCSIECICRLLYLSDRVYGDNNMLSQIKIHNSFRPRLLRIPVVQCVLCTHFNSAIHLCGRFELRLGHRS